jgi:histidinol-phosphatase
MEREAVDPDDVEFAHRLVTAAAEVALPFVGDSVRHQQKLDGSPVSEADFAAERAMLALLGECRPDDGVESEEAGLVATGRRRWLLDPIDGTAQFVRGDPEWGTHVALLGAEQVVLGVISRPLRGRRWWAATGHGAFRDDDSAPTARSVTLQTSGATGIQGARVGLYRRVDTRLPELLAQYGATTVMYGSHILDLVEGRLDAIVSERCGYAWDHAPAVILAVEAGGRFTDPDGGTRPDLQGGIYSNGHLHEELIEFMAQHAVELGGSM